MSFENEFIYWPNDLEKEEIISANEERFGSPNLVGFLDGSTIDLACTPSWVRKDEFYGRKSSSCVNTFAICDHNRKIRYFTCGWFGSAHGMRVLTESSFYKNIDKYFAEDEYVLGDGGYKKFKFLVPICKKPKNEPISPDDEKFNTYIAMMRIKIEHAFGILKERFYSLKSLPIKIRRRSDMQYVNAWITVCVILNNFLLEQDDDDLTTSMKADWDRREKEKLEQISRDGYDDEDDEKNERSRKQKIPDSNYAGGIERYNDVKKIVLIANGRSHLLRQ